jgi:hypothetical protein
MLPTASSYRTPSMCDATHGCDYRLCDWATGITVAAAQTETKQPASNTQANAFFICITSFAIRFTSTLKDCG